MKVKPILAFDDNFMYVVSSGNVSLVVDPVQPNGVKSYIENNGIPYPAAVLTTHHHWDHADGNPEFKTMYPNVEVYGGCSRIKALTHELKHAEFGPLEVTCLHTPCHTSSHFCYFIKDTSLSETQSDDFFLTVFTGCGKFFEGTAEEMKIALVDILGSLPPETKVFCGHEYTVTNLKFCNKIEPENQDIKRKLDWAITKRQNNEFTIPSTIGEEKLCNVFMRVSHLKTLLSSPDDVACMKQLREQKNAFRP